MVDLSAFHLLFWLVVIAIFLVPMTKILEKAGFSGWWAIIWVVPLVNLVALWVFAFTRWPSLEGRRDA